MLVFMDETQQQLKPTVLSKSILVGESEEMENVPRRSEEKIRRPRRQKPCRILKRAN